MSLGADIFAALTAVPAVTDLVGKRIYPQVLQQKTAFPAVAYTIISDVPENAFSQVADRLSNARLQIDVYAYDSDDADAAFVAIDQALSALANPPPGLSAWREDRRDLYENETQLYRVSGDFAVWR